MFNIAVYVFICFSKNNIPHYYSLVHLGNNLGTYQHDYCFDPKDIPGYEEENGGGAGGGGGGGGGGPNGGNGGPPN